MGTSVSRSWRDLALDGAEHLALLDHAHVVEGAQVVGVHGEERDELVDPLGHPLVERRERLEVLGDLGPLGGVLLEEPLLDDEGDVLLGDADLLEAVADAADGVGDAGEPRVVEDRLLQAGDETEPGRRGDLADLAQEGEVVDELAVAPAAEVVEQLVEDEEQARGRGGRPRRPPSCRRRRPSSS